MTERDIYAISLLFPAFQLHVDVNTGVESDDRAIDYWIDILPLSIYTDQYRYVPPILMKSPELMMSHRW